MSPRLVKRIVFYHNQYVQDGSRGNSETLDNLMVSLLLCYWKRTALERGPLSLLSTTDDLLERKTSGSGLENRDNGRSDPSRLPPGILYPLRLALTSSISGGRSVGIVRSLTPAMELFFEFLVRP
jgi:hypothetical protein